jgi:chromosome segregation ATPase
MQKNIDELSEAVRKLQKAVVVLEQQKAEATQKLKKVETVLKQQQTEAVQKQQKIEQRLQKAEQQKTETSAKQAETSDPTSIRNAQAERERVERSLETFDATLKHLEMNTQKQPEKTYRSSAVQSGDSMKKILADMLSEHRKISGVIGDMRKDIESLREYQLKNRQTVTI